MGTKIAKFGLLPLLAVACSGLAFKPANETVPAPMQQKEQKQQEQAALHRVNETYTLKKMIVRFDQGTGYYDVQLAGYSNGGDSTGTGKPTQMFFGFAVRPGDPENVYGNNTLFTLKKNDFKYDGRYNNLATIDLELKPNTRYGNNKSVATITPQDDPMADPEKTGSFEASFRFTGELPVTVTDMYGNPVQDPQDVLNKMHSTSVLGSPVYFMENVINGIEEQKFPSGYSAKASEFKKRTGNYGQDSRQGNPQNNRFRQRRDEYNFYRTTILGDGQQSTNYFPEDMILTGAQINKPN